MSEQVHFYESLQKQPETSTPQQLPQGMIQCPNCVCIFTNTKDYARHQNAYGHYSEAHRKNWATAMQRRLEGRE